MKRFMGEEPSKKAESDYTDYNILLELWKSENPIKTNKLQVLLVVNGLLVSTVQVAGGFVPENWALYLAGAIFSFVWVLSIGRTSLYQRYWQEKISILSIRYESDDRFQILNIGSDIKTSTLWTLNMLGGISSKYYLLGAPIVFALLWLGALAFTYNQLDKTLVAISSSEFNCPSGFKEKIERVESSVYSKICVNIAQGKREVWKDGYKHIDSFYENGKKHGMWKYYDSKGGVTKEIKYEHGVQK